MASYTAGRDILAAQKRGVPGYFGHASPVRPSRFRLQRKERAPMNHQGATKNFVASSSCSARLNQVRTIGITADCIRRTETRTPRFNHRRTARKGRRTMQNPPQFSPAPTAPAVLRGRSIEDLAYQVGTLGAILLVLTSLLLF